MIIEWVGPLWVRPGISMSMSGAIEAMKIRGRLGFTFNALPKALLVKYPIAMWPTAYNADHLLVLPYFMRPDSLVFSSTRILAMRVRGSFRINSLSLIKDSAV